MKAVVLIVDDVHSNLEYVQEIVESEGIDTLRAINGVEAIEIARNHMPDLILLDIAMPQMDGYQVCRFLKSDNKLKHIPVIFLTARVQEEDIVNGFDAGAVDYILKPFNYRELLSRVLTHLELKQKTEALKNMNLRLEEKVAERTAKLQQTNEELTKAYHELTKLDYAKNEFIAHINHEMRTPLNGILGYSSLLEEVLEPKHHEEFLKPIQSITNRLIKVAELTLVLTELKTTNHKIEKEDINILDVIKEAIEKVDYSDKNLEFVVECPNQTLNIVAETNLLVTCLAIIIDNSVKYAPDSSQIHIQVQESKSAVRVVVTDCGPGFTQKALANLFEIFEADNLQYRSHGFGLGLATAKAILNIFNGQITATNKDNGHGASVTLLLQKESKP